MDPGVPRCLTGTFTGVELTSKRACSLEVRADGTLAMTHNDITDLVTAPFGSSNFTKGTYIPIPSTSPTGFVILWLASSGTRSGSDRASQIYFKFNASYDDVLSMELSVYSGGTISRAVTCRMPVP
jgi:hypothetical protein